MGRPATDITGQHFGRYKVIARAGSNKRKKAIWLCRCDCGNERIVLGLSLRVGQTKSCGCQKSELVSARSTLCWVKHGHCKRGNRSSEFNAWGGMQERCYNPNCLTWKHYGGRGITVCDRWHRDNPKGFINFLSDMGRKPATELSIDRINNDGNYEPTNCRWATRKQQRANQRKALPQT